jgi:hypothetical protein
LQVFAFERRVPLTKSPALHHHRRILVEIRPSYERRALSLCGWLRLIISKPALAISHRTTHVLNELALLGCQMLRNEFYLEVDRLRNGRLVHSFEGAALSGRWLFLLRRNSGQALLVLGRHDEFK